MGHSRCTVIQTYVIKQDVKIKKASLEVIWSLLLPQGWIRDVCAHPARSLSSLLLKTSSLSMLCSTCHGPEGISGLNGPDQPPME